MKTLKLILISLVASTPVLSQTTATLTSASYNNIWNTLNVWVEIKESGAAKTHHFKVSDVDDDFVADDASDGWELRGTLTIQKNPLLKSKYTFKMSVNREDQGVNVNPTLVLGAVTTDLPTGWMGSATQNVQWTYPYPKTPIVSYGYNPQPMKTSQDDCSHLLPWVPSGMTAEEAAKLLKAYQDCVQNRKKNE